MIRKSVTLLGANTIRFFAYLGQFGSFVWQVLKSLGDVRTYSESLPDQMVRIGVRSLPIVLVISAFTGMVTAVQGAYQLRLGFIPLYAVATAVVESVVLELAPVLTALVLSGRVGATITAELGTMKVTEQLDALESLAFNPISYLVVPRVLAGLVMFPALTAFSAFVGILAGGAMSVATMDMTVYDFLKGGRMFFVPWDAFYGQIKAVFFGLTITLVACHEGFNAKGGAEGVGVATTRSVVVSCMLILVLDYFLALILL